MKTAWVLSLLAGFLVAPVAAQTNEVKRVSDIEFAKPDGVALLLDLYLPVDVSKPPLAMFIHGGSWKNGNRKGCKLAWAAEHGFAVASIEYRMSQEGVFPAQIYDCKGALRWLRAHADKYGYDASRVTVAGTSAGGHLALLMGTSGGVKELEGDVAGHLDQSSRVQGVVDYYGPSDFVARAKSHPDKCEVPSGSVYQLLGGKVSEHLELARLASPVTHVTSDDPPLLILHGSKDNTVKMDQPEIMRDSYETAGLDVKMYVREGAGHGFSSTSPDERRMVLDALRRWLKHSPAPKP